MSQLALNSLPKRKIKNGNPVLNIIYIPKYVTTINYQVWYYDTIGHKK